MPLRKYFSREYKFLRRAYISFAFAFFFIVLTLIGIYQLSLKVDDLNQNTGQVVDIFIEKRKDTRGKLRHSIIIDHSVNNDLNRYRLGHAYRSYLTELHNQIAIRDTITIYTRKTVLGIGRKHTILHIEKDNVIIFSLQQSKKEILKIVIVTVISSVVFFFLFYYNQRAHRKPIDQHLVIHKK